MTIYINHADQTDIPAVLRQLAEDIESGEMGRAFGCAVVMDLPDMPEMHRIMVHFGGKGEAAPSAHLLLCKGAAKIVGTK